VIFNNERTQAVSSLGWVDKGSLWVYSIGEASPRKVVLSDAKYLSVKSGAEDFFAVVHHWDGNRLEISAHSHSKPQHSISRLSLRQAIPNFPSKITILREGDLSVWERLPGAFTGYAFGDYQLVLTRHVGEDDVQTFAWFDNGYDKGYQGIVGVTDVPDSALLIVSVQRDSHPVLYDPESKKAVGKLSLQDRRGNPSFHLRITGHEFWAVDYDTVVKLDAKTLTVKNAVCLENRDRGKSQFVGSLCFSPDETRCLVARPFRGDAVVFDANSMSIVQRIDLGRQPLAIGWLAEGTLISRDWKTGDFLSRKL
jgi:hypothetical protein